jgi:hypothetical protein
MTVRASTHSTSEARKAARMVVAMRAAPAVGINITLLCA